MRKEDEEMLRKIREMRKKGMNLAEIAKKLDKSIHYVYQRVNKLYYPKRLRK